MIRCFRALTIIALVLLSGSNPLDGENPQTKQETQSAKARAIGHRLQQKGIPNFGEVTPRLYRGGLVNNDGLKAIAKLGVNIVVDTRANNKTEKQEVHNLGMEYISIAWHCPWPSDEVFARFLKLLEENKDKKVFVHCRLGDDRTGMMIAAYRMAEEGWTANEAMNEMRSFGFSRSHHVICPGLARYEQEFPRRFKEDPAFDEIRRTK